MDAVLLDDDDELLQEVLHLGIPERPDVTDDGADLVRKRASVHRGANYLDEDAAPPWGSSHGEEYDDWGDHIMGDTPRTIESSTYLAGLDVLGTASTQFVRPKGGAQAGGKPAAGKGGAQAGGKPAAGKGAQAGQKPTGGKPATTRGRVVSPVYAAVATATNSKFKRREMLVRTAKRIGDRALAAAKKAAAKAKASTRIKGDDVLGAALLRRGLSKAGPLGPRPSGPQRFYVVVYDDDGNHAYAPARLVDVPRLAQLARYVRTLYPNVRKAEVRDSTTDQVVLTYTRGQEHVSGDDVLGAITTEAARRLRLTQAAKKAERLGKKVLEATRKFEARQTAKAAKRKATKILGVLYAIAGEDEETFDATLESELGERLLAAAGPPQVDLLGGEIPPPAPSPWAIPSGGDEGAAAINDLYWQKHPYRTDVTLYRHVPVDGIVYDGSRGYPNTGFVSWNMVFGGGDGFIHDTKGPVGWRAHRGASGPFGQSDNPGMPSNEAPKSPDYGSEYGWGPLIGFPPIGFPLPSWLTGLRWATEDGVWFWSPLEAPQWALDEAAMETRDEQLLAQQAAEAEAAAEEAERLAEEKVEAAEERVREKERRREDEEREREHLREEEVRERERRQQEAEDERQAKLQAAEDERLAREEERQAQRQAAEDERRGREQERLLEHERAREEQQLRHELELLERMPPPGGGASPRTYPEAYPDEAYADEAYEEGMPTAAPSYEGDGEQMQEMQAQAEEAARLQAEQDSYFDEGALDGALLVDEG